MLAFRSVLAKISYVNSFKRGCLNRLQLVRKFTMSAEKKMNNQKVIGTHDGKFHCDEVLACALLKLLPEYSTAVIKRTRDQTILDTCDVVVDVGGKFDPETHRYDHHQRTFQESFSSLKSGYPWTTRLSSAGLVYLHFGQEILSHVMNMPVDSELVRETFHKVYEGFIEEVDAIDNGISTHDGLARYKVTTTVSSRVGNLNPAWNEEKEVDVMTRFNQAMEMLKTEFLDKVNYFSKRWWPARELVVEAINNRFKIDPSGKIMELSTGGCPWKEHLFPLEKKLGLDDPEKQLIYVIYEDMNKSWRIQGVPPASQSFDLRCGLPEAWRGYRDKELDTVSGIEGCIFVHASGFIGGNATREGAIKMAQKSLSLQK